MGNLVEDFLPVTPSNDTARTETPVVRSSHKSLTGPVESPATAMIGDDSVSSNANLIDAQAVPYSNCLTASDGISEPESPAVLYAINLNQPSGIRRK